MSEKMNIPNSKDKDATHCHIEIMLFLKVNKIYWKYTSLV